MGPTTRFDQVGVWKKAHALVLATYKLTESFPKSETYGLVSQVRRTAVSIPANFAEGHKRLGKTDKARFMNIAQGSIEEVRYYLILAQDLGYAQTEQVMQGLDEVSRMLEAYRARLLTPVS
jgi:four helix bundle protein